MTRESFSIIPRKRATAKDICLGVRFDRDRMMIHIIQEISTVIRFVIIVRRRAGRRGDRSTQRPSALEKNSTQIVSAMPLEINWNLAVNVLAVNQVRQERARLTLSMMLKGFQEMQFG